LTDIEDKFDIEKQLTLRRRKAATRIFFGYLIVALLIFFALSVFLMNGEFFEKNPIVFVAMITGVLTINIIILFLFIIKPSDKSSISLDLMNYLNQKLDADMKMHIIQIEQNREEMECMDMSGKYPRMFMLTINRPMRPLLNDMFKVPVYYSKPSGRLNLKVKYSDPQAKSKLIKKSGGLKDFSTRRGNFPKHEYWSKEFSRDKKRNFLVGSIYFGYRKGNETITELAKNMDDVLKKLKRIESGK
jgi:hypothetical protein